MSTRADEPTGQHLPDVEAGHDGLARARVVGQQEAQARLHEHVVVDGDALVRQRVDKRDFGGKGRVGEVSIGEPLPLHDGTHDLRVGGKIDGGHILRLKYVGLCNHVQLALLLTAQWEPRGIDYSWLEEAGQ